MSLSCNYARQVGLQVNQARRAFLSGEKTKTLALYNKAIRAFVHLCIEKGALPFKQAAALEDSLSISQRDLKAFPLQDFSEGLYPSVERNILENRKVIIVAGNTAVGKNILADCLVQKLQKERRAARLVDIDKYEFIRREMVSEAKPLSQQLREDDILNLYPFVETAEQSLAEGEVVVLPVYTPIVDRLPEQWPRQLIQIKQKRPGAHQKVLRWLLFQMENVELELRDRRQVFFLDITDMKSQRDLIAWANQRPDYSIDLSSGIGMDRNGSVICSQKEEIDMFDENPFYGSLANLSSGTILRDFSVNRKMLGILRLWERLADKQ